MEFDMKHLPYYLFLVGAFLVGISTTSCQKHDMIGASIKVSGPTNENVTVIVREVLEERSKYLAENPPLFSWELSVGLALVGFSLVIWTGFYILNRALS